MNDSSSKTNINKMIFIMNAIESGWTVKRHEDSYVFTKKHENKREVFMETYLEKFVINNMSMKPFK
jgi:hypothetical protein